MRGCQWRRRAESDRRLKSGQGQLVSRQVGHGYTPTVDTSCAMSRKLCYYGLPDWLRCACHYADESILYMPISLVRKAFQRHRRVVRLPACHQTDMAKRETSRPCLERSILGNKKGSEDRTEIFRSEK